MLECYRGQCPKSDPVKYITRAYIDDFAADAQALLNEVYNRYLSEK